MATNKKAAKPVSKKPASKAPAKKAAVKKAAKPAPKKAVKASKPIAKKPFAKAKPSSKNSAKPIKKIAPAKKAAKPVAKKAVPKKVATPVKKSIPVKKAVKPAPKKTVAPIKKVAAPVKTQVKAEPKKIESKKPDLKPLPKAKDIKVPPPKPVVLPKITATKARKYEPEFTKSVLDQAPYENNGPTMRYSDGELNEFRELIQRKLETAKKELGYLQGLITRKDEMGGDDTDNRYMTMEDGSLSMEREQLSQMASRQITFIDHLEKAMMRIENKTYGICRVTGKLIDKARLRAVPHATLSIEAKMGIAK
ncbi:MAG: TraR/DksA family transcriptional regulator [Chitinophagaceae bacterium]|nr:TraR/DksA family transcriptional regulator [Chitinophagaceae bacterium]